MYGLESGFWHCVWSNRTVFDWASKVIVWLLLIGFAFAMHFDWSKQVLRHSQPIQSRSKTKITQASRRRLLLLALLIVFFFKVKPIANYFGFWLVEIVFLRPLWVAFEYFGFWLVEIVFLRPLWLALWLLWLLVGWNCFLTAFVSGVWLLWFWCSTVIRKPLYRTVSNWVSKVILWLLWFCVYCAFWLIEASFTTFSANLEQKQNQNHITKQSGDGVCSHCWLVSSSK